MARPRSRFSGFIDQNVVKKNSPITVIGDGGIGSRASTSLAEIGFNLILWDDDTVKEENIGSQKFGFPDLGKKKVFVSKERLENNFRVAVDPRTQKYEGQADLSGIVICGVDSKKTRALIWPFIKNNPFIPLYLDGRVGGERYKLFAFNPCDSESIRKYETQIDLKIKSMQARCTEKFAPQAGMALDFYIWVAIKEHLTGGKVPFLTAGKNFDVRFQY